MALTKIITDTIDLSSDTTALKMPKGTTTQRPDVLTVDYLVVAGGGGGGWVGGGGGAGGYLTDSISLSTGVAYDVIIGAGGLASTNGGSGGSPSGNPGGQGDNSKFSSIEATGGGGGGSFPATSGYEPTSGGSGGGAASAGGSYSGAIASPAGQGNDGGANWGTSGNYGGGGGGGAGAVGSNGSSCCGGNGGVGLVTTLITASIASTYSVGENDGNGNIYFAGGGGGAVQDGSNNPPTNVFGTGGLGGGVDGENNAQDTVPAAPNNTGGGGGAGATSKNGTGAWIYGSGGDGGSGVVIIRTPSNYTATFTSGVTANGNSGSSITPDTSTGYNVWIVTATSDALQTVTFSGTAPTSGTTRENTTTGKMEIYTGAKGWRALQQTGQDVGIVPSNNFNTVLYVGNRPSDNIITGVGFQPDLTWIKDMDATESNTLFDNVRGAYALESNTQSVQSNFVGYFNFDSDGFTVGDSGQINTSSSNIVSWNWKAGGAAVQNNDGSINGTDCMVSANADAGFSIIKWTGSTSSSPESVGHNLGKAPELVILKNMDAVDAWYTYVEGVTGNNQYLKLNTTDAVITAGSDSWGAGPTSSVMGLRPATFAGTSSQNLIMYCWTSIPGYSLIGTYTGTITADFPIIYTGFEPAWLMIKQTDSTNYWYIWDNKRSTSNPRQDTLEPNTAAVELHGVGIAGVRFLNNGFQIQSIYTYNNAEAGEYLFMCFAS